MHSEVLKTGQASDGAGTRLKTGARHLVADVLPGFNGGPLGASLCQQAARVIPGLLLALGCLTSQAAGQGPALTYEKKASWAETLVVLRTQTAGQAGRFVPQPAFPRWPPGRTPATASPLVALWAQLERDFPLECDWMLQDLAARGYPCSNPPRPDQYPLRWFGPRADADLEQKLLLGVVEELGDAGETARMESTCLASASKTACSSAKAPSWSEISWTAASAWRNSTSVALAK